MKARFVCEDGHITFASSTYLWKPCEHIVQCCTDRGHVVDSGHAHTLSYCGKLATRQDTKVVNKGGANFGY